MYHEAAAPDEGGYSCDIERAPGLELSMENAKYWKIAIMKNAKSKDQ